MTLGAFDFTKTVIHQRKKINIDIPSTVNSSYTKVKCDNSGKWFKVTNDIFYIN